VTAPVEFPQEKLIETGYQPMFVLLVTFIADDFPYSRLIIEMMGETHEDAKDEESNHLGGRNPMNIAKALLIGPWIEGSERFVYLRREVWRGGR
jgi:hypothetical protein